MTMAFSGERPMLTSFDPTGISFSTEFSNFSTSFGISILPRKNVTRICPLVATRILEPFAYAADPRELPPGRWSAADNDGRNIVSTPGEFRELDESRCGLLRVVALSQHGGNLRIRELARESVRAEKHRIAILHELFGDIDFDLGFDAESANEHILQIAAAGFFRGHSSPANLLGDKRMVLSELFDSIAPQPVDSAVTNVRDAHALIGKAHCYHGRTHRLPGRILFGGFVHNLIGQSYGAGEAIRDFRNSVDTLAGCRLRRVCIRFAAVLDDRLDRQTAGHFSRRQPAHAV